MTELHKRIRWSTWCAKGTTQVMPVGSVFEGPEHDLDVPVTEQGLADLRGLSPRERAKTIINNCIHPDYKPLMQEYYDRAKRECCELNVGHEPHLLFKVFKMQQHLVGKGTMKINKWN
ncbi:acetyl-CoA hydrolase/transferase C-terminal domain-containing protein [Geomonas subterranea]|uniref:Acetyl-CoA hydrolase/transferase C-terminal domain-containing protein n=1 Tax=Geomonas subterranea TaxID=2847989 RepID=A0ABX8LK80_9BACT|nr:MULTISPECIES: acetyl-CoA hydrolase/transferase C-terminal domain-containing protein [Geomonas]QXE91242.1 hypothetical protein KP001_01490 [Geomonas subterranea]QXM10671.1 hypothetical protein KP002_06005 [Geomonas subterranea]